MNEFDLKVGFSRLDVTPPLGVSIGGYFGFRYSEGVLDPIEVNTVALSKDGKSVVFAVLDNLGAHDEYTKLVLEAVSAKTGLPEDAVFFSSTHSHTTPFIEITPKLSSKVDIEYSEKLIGIIAESAALALADMRPAKMGLAESRAEGVAFNRRYLMKDGTTETNPGVNNPRVDKCIGPVDERVNLVRFLRDDGTSILLLNFGNHPDTIGGSKISSDWPGLTRRVFERAVPDAKCVVLNGAQGDLNHINPFPKEHELAGMIIDFDNVPRGYCHAEHMANVMAASALSVYGKMKYVSADSIDFKVKTIDVPTNMPSPEEIEPARVINDLYKAGRKDELPYEGMMLTTMLANASRIIKLEHGPASKPMMLTAVRIGNIAFLGIPGEPFAGIGLGIKESLGWDMVLPCCLVNGDAGYFPMKDSYDEGGYEAKSSPFKAGVGELIIDEAKKLLDDIR